MKLGGLSLRSAQRRPCRVDSASRSRATQHLPCPAAAANRTRIDRVLPLRFTSIHHRWTDVRRRRSHAPFATPSGAWPWVRTPRRRTGKRFRCVPGSGRISGSESPWRPKPRLRCPGRRFVGRHGAFGEPGRVRRFGPGAGARPGRGFRRSSAEGGASGSPQVPQDGPGRGFLHSGEGMTPSRPSRGPGCPSPLGPRALSRLVGGPEVFFSPPPGLPRRVVVRRREEEK